METDLLNYVLHQIEVKFSAHLARMEDSKTVRASNYIEQARYFYDNMVIMVFANSRTLASLLALFEYQVTSMSNEQSNCAKRMTIEASERQAELAAYIAVTNIFLTELKTIKRVGMNLQQARSASNYNEATIVDNGIRYSVDADGVISSGVDGMPRSIIHALPESIASSNKWEPIEEAEA